MCLVHSNKLRVRSNASHDSHLTVMHQAASEVLTSFKFGVAIIDDMYLVHNSKFCW